MTNRQKLKEEMKKAFLRIKSLHYALTDYLENDNMSEVRKPLGIELAKAETLFANLQQEVMKEYGIEELVRIGAELNAEVNINECFE